MQYLRVFPIYGKLVKLFEHTIADVKSATIFFMIYICFFALMNFALETELYHKQDDDNFNGYHDSDGPPHMVYNTDFIGLPIPLTYFFQCWSTAVGRTEVPPYN